MPRTPPLVTVVIPTYNRAALVPHAVESALSQTHGAINVIVVDNGSTDGTLRALERFADRIQVVVELRRGASAARNRGLADAAGQWVAFLDSDDTWADRRIAQMLDFARRHDDVGYVMSGRRLVTCDGTPTTRTYSWLGRDARIDPVDLLAGMRCGSGLVRRDLASAVGGFDEEIRASEDVDFCLRLSFHTRLAEVSGPLLLQRVHGRTLSRGHHVTAAGRFRLLEKLQRDHPEFVAAHPWTIRRFRASAHSRMGRALLTGPECGREERRGARRQFLSAARLDPLELEHWRYLLIATLTPGLYRARRPRDETEG
jgi:glycosyltransferase involved in cell wall biosynthesis